MIVWVRWSSTPMPGSLSDLAADRAWLSPEILTHRQDHIVEEMDVHPVTTILGVIVGIGLFGS
jgi:hypothetical protein